MAPFNRKTEAFKGYQLEAPKALEKVDPQILLGLDPVPITSSTKFFLKMMNRNQALKLEAPAVKVPEKVSFFSRFK